MLRKACKEACVLGKGILMRMELPKKVKHIISKLEEKGYEAYAVGGCVRDTILGRVPLDWDITTSAKPLEIKGIFPVTLDTGLQHGTVTVMIEKEGYEVTTFRLDGAYSDGRHPDEVSFTSSLVEDLKRRDFTINAMAYSDKTGLVDEFSGMEDLKNKTVRSVGRAEERFTEDALRMLRAIRFAGQLGFSIEAETFEAVKKLSENIARVSAERIAKELEKLILSDGCEKIKLIYEAGIFAVIAPEIDEFFKTKPERVNKAIKAMENAVYHTKKGLHRIRTVLFFEELGENKACELLKSLKSDNDTINTVRHLIPLLGREVECSELEMRRTVNLCGHKAMPLLLEARRAKGLRDVTALYEDIVKKGCCTDISGLKVNGNDLLEAGVPKGVMIGKTLNRLLEMVIENPEFNTREKLLSEVRENEE